MKILGYLLTLTLAIFLWGCDKSSTFGKVDEWTWDAPDLKVCTSPDKRKRARADLKNGDIELKIGKAGQEHPVDIMIEYSEIVPIPKNGKWKMTWLDNSVFSIEHPDLGTKIWTVTDSSPMTVKLKTDWN